MPKLIRLTITVYLLFISSALVAYAGNISPEAQKVLQFLAPHEELSVIITLSDKADIHLFKERGRSLRRSKIIKTLKSKADLTQRPLKIFLQGRGQTHHSPVDYQWNCCNPPGRSGA